MLFLAYTFETTEHANAHPDGLWPWMADRNRWFYEGLDMVLATNWRVQHQPEGLLIHHEVAFADEAALARYRAVLAARGRRPAWAERHREQSRWYRIISRSVQTSPPVPMALPRHRPGTGASDRDDPPGITRQPAYSRHPRRRRPRPTTRRTPGSSGTRPLRALTTARSPGTPWNGRHLPSRRARRRSLPRPTVTVAGGGWCAWFSPRSSWAARWWFGRSGCRREGPPCARASGPDRSR